MLYSKVPVFIYNEASLTLRLCFSDITEINQGVVRVPCHNGFIFKRIHKYTGSNEILGIIIGFEKSGESMHYIFDYDELSNVMRVLLKKNLKDFVQYSRSNRKIKRYEKRSFSRSILSN